MMRVSKMTVYRLVHSGELPAIRFGRSFRVPESAVRAAVSPTTTSAEAPGSVADAGLTQTRARLLRGIFPWF